MTKKVKKTKNEPATMDGILVHLGELRRRLLFLVCIWVFLGIFFWIYAPQTANFLLEPILEYSDELLFLESQGALRVRLGMVFWMSFFALAPFIFWQFYSFASPGLFRKEKRLLAIGFLSSMALFAFGSFVAFSFVLPSALHFFISFESISEFVRFQPLLGGYMSLVFQIVFAMGLVFQVPLILALLLHRGILSSLFLVRIRPYVWIGSFVIAAIVTPPDPMSQLILAVPMVVFYEICILVVRSRAKALEGRKL